MDDYIDPARYGAMILDALLGSDMSQTELGEKLGVSQQSVSKWVRGESMPRPGVRKRLAEVLNDPTLDVSLWQTLKSTEPPIMLRQAVSSPRRELTERVEAVGTKPEMMELWQQVVEALPEHLKDFATGHTRFDYESPALVLELKKFAPGSTGRIYEALWQLLNARKEHPAARLVLALYSRNPFALPNWPDRHRGMQQADDQGISVVHVTDAKNISDMIEYAEAK